MPAYAVEVRQLSLEEAADLRGAAAEPLRQGTAMGQFEQFKRRVLRLIALLGAFEAVLLTLYYGLWLHNRPLAYACTAYGVVTAAIVAGSFLRAQLTEWLGMLLMVATTALVLTGIYLNTSDSINDAWLVIIAPLAFALRAPRRATFWVAVNLLGMFAIRGLQEAPLPLASAFNVALAYIATAVVVAIFAVQNRKNVKLIHMLSKTDSLTGLLNRRSFVHMLEEEYRRNLRHGFPMTVCMIDVDHFKAYNDQYGHLAGDEALAEIAAILRKTARRADDHVFRYGGEEFCVLCSGAERGQAETLAEQLRAGVEMLDRVHHVAASGRMTVSVGLSHLENVDGMTPEQMVKCADMALYRAKQNGRNRVEVFRDVVLTERQGTHAHLIDASTHPAAR